MESKLDYKEKTIMVHKLYRNNSVTVCIHFDFQDIFACKSLGESLIKLDIPISKYKLQCKYNSDT